MRTFGLIPAAGKSSRMGQPKLLLPVGGTTVLERVLTAVRAGGVADVVVVVGPALTALADAARGRGAHVLALPVETADMRATCVHGLDWLETRFAPAPDDGWLLLPADHPTCRPDVVRALLAAAGQHHEWSIVVPVHEGRRGHPVWLRWRHVAAIRALPAQQGLNAFIRERTAETLELTWPDAEILRDLDTPEDYRRLVSGIERPMEG
jgi:molybdenum cofactor cytidylyltransferase